MNSGHVALTDARVPAGETAAGAETVSSRRRDALNLLLLTVVWIAAVCLVHPRGEFPLIDDWVYRWSVDEFLNGRFVLHSWTSATMAGHIVWGGLFASLFGPGFEVLRISGLTAGLLGGVALYLWLRSARVKPGRATAGALCLMFNPIYFVLSFTFMTDVPYVAAQTAAMALLGHGLASGRPMATAAGWLLALCALSIRQIGVAVPVGIGIATIWRHGWGWRTIALAIVPVVTFVAIQRSFESWLAATGRIPLQFGQNSGEIASRLTEPWSVIATQAGNGLIYLYLYGGLFALPIAVVAYRDVTARLRPKVAAIAHASVFATALAFALAILLIDGPLPIWRDGILWRSGIAVGHFGAPEAPGWLRSVVTILASLGGAMTSVVVGRRMWGAQRSGEPPHVVATWVSAFMIAAVLFAPLLVMPTRFDRYLLPIIPCIIAIVLVSGDRTPNDDLSPRMRVRLPTIVAALLFVISAAFAVAGTRDVFAEERARLAGLNHAVALGYPRDQINAGWVLNGWHLYGRIGAMRNVAALASWHNDPLMQVVLRPSRGYEVIARIPVSRALPWAWNADAPILVERRLPGYGSEIGPFLHNRWPELSVGPPGR